MSAPLVMVDAAADADQARDDLVAAGWTVRDVADDAGRVAIGSATVVQVAVADERDAARALSAAVAGSGVLAVVPVGAAIGDVLCDDLSRVGPVDDRRRGTAPPVLDADERAVVVRLLAGDALPDVAAALHLSLRTAERRVASARAAYGVTTTAALLAAARHRFPAPPLVGGEGAPLDPRS